LQGFLAAHVLGTFPQNSPTDPVADDDNVSIPSSSVSILSDVQDELMIDAPPEVEAPQLHQTHIFDAAAIQADIRDVLHA